MKGGAYECLQKYTWETKQIGDMVGVMMLCVVGLNVDVFDMCVKARHM